jgi:hypothetical protein
MKWMIRRAGIGLRNVGYLSEFMFIGCVHPVFGHLLRGGDTVRVTQRSLNAGYV